MVFAGALLSHGELARAAKQTHSVGSLENMRDAG